ncbi:peptide-methionine (S)-S-oxide reductase MsrA [Acuticoccus sp. I52.16.1]|uniref:peptide-methionine (S)-S-oxide reductase MsrA n=1 Tax=Acuticoccus sp. I52.16.1 TaxID=2928472 RepID=UPI001FD0C778|nr:peptide-methionine (S)-S-oxide reductase MsrA [Acuticoccus sp. I52.16.1]UOM34272.1 peptide-methionine (S)-S-oxide reductase MsrA [Acuticoccus sp. I52.16.1]
MTKLARAWVTALALATGLTVGILSVADAKADTATAIFAGGCFWCVEADFDKVDGVVGTVSGYTGGTLDNPTYEAVSHEDTGHYEAVEISYDPAKVNYAALVAYFFRHVDPVDAGGQFCDRGPSYRTAIFVRDDAQRRAAEDAKAEAARILGHTIATPILTADTFYPAEGYHQDYYEKNPLKYKYYRWRCGRDARVEELWGEARTPS